LFVVQLNHANVQKYSEEEKQKHMGKKFLVLAEFYFWEMLARIFAFSSSILSLKPIILISLSSMCFSVIISIS